jgi:hypothetical protein
MPCSNREKRLDSHASVEKTHVEEQLIVTSFRLSTTSLLQLTTNDIEEHSFDTKVRIHSLMGSSSGLERSLSSIDVEQVHVYS